MMKKWFTYSFSFGLILLIAMTSGGYSIAEYCCSGCKAQGIETVTKHMCQEVHQTSCCANEKKHEHEAADHENRSCKLHYFKVNESMAQSLSTSTELSEKFIILFASVLFNQVPDNVSQLVELEVNTGPPLDNRLLSGVNILHSKCVYLI